MQTVYDLGYQGVILICKSIIILTEFLQELLCQKLPYDIGVICTGEWVI